MSAINAFNPTSTPCTSSDAFSSLTSGQFLQIIFTELTNQDPLEPNDSSAMIDQLSSLRAIESDTQMVESLERMVSQNELASASQLIGSLVSGITLDNRRVSDLVISVSMTQDGPVLNMFDGSRMFFSNVDEIVGPIDDLIDPNDDDIDDDIDDDDIDDDDNDDNSNTIGDVPSGVGNVGSNGNNTGPIDGVDIDPIRQVVSNDV